MGVVLALILIDRVWKIRVIVRIAKKIQIANRLIYDHYRNFLHSGHILVADWDVSKNVGDQLSPFIIQRLTGQHVRKPLNRSENRLFAVGSILQRASSNSIVWGSGFISGNSKVIEPPRKIYAVRGPLSRKIYQDNGLECPEVFGDPGILLPKLIEPSKKIQGRIGLVPHYVDQKTEWVRFQAKYKTVKIINVKQSIGSFVKELTSCDYVISSSLHGLIIADAYGIPNVRVKLSDGIVGGDFKFLDYRLGINATPHAVKVPGELETALDLINDCSLANVEGSAKNLLTNFPCDKL